MISFEQKLAVIESFPELRRNDVSLGRINFHYEESAHDKKSVVYHLHPNGNGFVYAGLLRGYETDAKGFVNIRDCSAEELRTLIADSIRSLSVKLPEPAPVKKRPRKSPVSAGGRWNGPDGQTLELRREDDLWYIYAGLNLEMVFETVEEAEQYLREEGFAPAPSPGTED